MFAATIRVWNSNRFGSFGSIVALTQWLFVAPKVSTRMKLASTLPLSELSGSARAAELRRRVIRKLMVLPS